MSSALTHPLLEEWEVEHGFGLRDYSPPEDLVRPKQVHGSLVAEISPSGGCRPCEADAIVGAEPGRAVGIVTADCVPILVAAPGGVHVAAIHAGWRGLAAGVIPAAIEHLAGLGAAPTELRSVVGPHIGPCCYEVDAPVRDAMLERFGARAEEAFQPTSPGHWRLALAWLARRALREVGIEGFNTGGFEGACTACCPERFYSYRRDADAAGRLVSFIRVRGRLDST